MQVFRKSFPDFLTDRSRCKDPRLFIKPGVHHEDILFLCLDLMKSRVKKNVCDSDDYAVVKDIPARRETYVWEFTGVRMPVWARHLAGVPGDGPHAKRVREATDQFFAKHLLCWNEVLNVVGHLGAAVYVINDVRQWCVSVSYTWTHSHTVYS